MDGENLRMKCKFCKTKMVKVIYMGLPMFLCTNENCNCIDGLWAFILDLIPFNGKMMVYKGSYWGALLNWLFNNDI
jgi:hypothetical protein